MSQNLSTSYKLLYFLKRTQWIGIISKEYAFMYLFVYLLKCISKLKCPCFFIFMSIVFHFALLIFQNLQADFIFEVEEISWDLFYLVTINIQYFVDYIYMNKAVVLIEHIYTKRNTVLSEYGVTPLQFLAWLDLQTILFTNYVPNKLIRILYESMEDV